MKIIHFKKGGDLMIQLVNEILLKFWVRIIDFLPDLFGGLLIIIIGVITAGIVKKILITLFTFFKLDYFINKAKLLEKNQFRLWEEIIGEIVKWTIIILFLIPTLEIWRLSKATNVLNQLLLYLPNVIVSVVILLIGLIVGNLIFELVKQSIATVNSKTAKTIALIAKSIVLFFTFLIVLNQLGVAQDLVRILFTGIIAMIAIAGGLAFGLGGKDLAKDLLEELKKNIR